MGGFFGVASKEDCVFDLFFGIDYHSHLGTRRGGMAVYGEDGFNRAIHNIENAPFRTKFDKDVQEMSGHKTIVLIAHRLKTVQQCDMIYLMHKGRIIDQGTYKELIENNSQFRNMAVLA
jgi:hypothetical protein